MQFNIRWLLAFACFSPLAVLAMLGFFGKEAKDTAWYYASIVGIAFCFLMMIVLVMFVVQMFFEVF
jgi:hypothetical protein